jgi:hypothetical protein
MPLLSLTHVLSLCLVVCVALSTPVIGWCAAARHQGQGLHALFAHVHHVDTPAEHVALDHAAAPSHVHDEPGTSWSASSVFGTTGPIDAIQALTPARVPAIVSGGDSRFFLALARPVSFIPAPVAPPPRLTG